MFGRKLSSNNSWAQQLQHPDPPPLVLIEDRVHGGGHVTRGRRPILLDLLHTELRCPWSAGTGLCEVTPRRGSSLRHERAGHGPWHKPAPRRGLGGPTVPMLQRRQAGMVSGEPSPQVRDELAKPDRRSARHDVQ